MFDSFQSEALAEVTVGEHCVVTSSLGEIGPDEIGSVEIGIREVSLGEVGPSEGSDSELGIDEDCLGESGLDEGGSREIGPDKGGLGDWPW